MKSYKRNKTDWVDFLTGVLTSLCVVLAVLTLAVVTACGSSSSSDNPVDDDGTIDDGSVDDDDGQPGDGDAPGAVSDSLQDLGVDTSFAPRVDEAGLDLPDDFAPLGGSLTVGQTDELFVMGMRLSIETPTGDFETLENRAGFVELSATTTPGVLEAGVLDVIAPGTVWEDDARSSHPSFGNSSNGAQSIRAATAGDVDGDGVDEILVVYVDTTEATADADTVRLEILDDADEGGQSVAGVILVAQRAPIRDVAVAAGDFDGDGRDELAIGLSTAINSELFLLRPLDDAESTTPIATFAANTDGWSLSLELQAGNLDRDAGEELIAVHNQYLGNNQAGTTAFYVFDDARRDHRELLGAQSVRAMDEDGLTHIAQVADVALGDVDGDGMDEIVLGGVSEFHNDACQSYQHVYQAFDDASDPEQAFSQLGEATWDAPYIPSGTGCNQASHQLRVRHVHMNAGDFDGDGLDEIQAGFRVFEDFVDAQAFTEIYALPPTAILRESQTVGGTISPATTDVTVADVNGDGRDDIVSFVQWNLAVQVWGLSGPAAETSEWSQLASIATEFSNGQTRIFPIVARANVDKDGLALQYSEGSYDFVFTEPIIIAALAAAPCATDIGQVTDACVTTYGTSETQDGGIDGTVTVSASTFIGGDVDIFGFGASVEERVTETASFTAGQAYTLEESVEYTTGPLEDTVIFTTLPLDRYSYTVLSHPDPTMVGRTVVVNLPRRPITLQVEREFYNEHVVEGALQVGANVFLHTPGDLGSYPTEADADALIDTGGLGHIGPLGELVDAAGQALGPLAERLLGNGLKSSRATTVGQGSGQTATEIRFSQSTSYRAGAEIAYQLEASTTAAGVTIGGSVGGSVGAGLSWGTSSSTVYRGSVGSIGGEQFSDNVYSFGLFTYIYNYGDRTQPQFEVLNFWVE